MPICKKCSKSFPNRLKIDEKEYNLQRRKYCFDCSPYGLHNTRKIEKIRLMDGQENCLCLLCNKEYIYDRNKWHCLHKCASCSANEQRVNRKIKMIKYKGGKCCRCGYNKCARALDFHHRNASEKTFNISGNHTLSWAKLKAELDKCDLVCSNCHREIEEDLSKNILMDAVGIEPTSKCL